MKPLKKIGDSVHRAVLRQDHNGPVLRGAGGVDHSCPHCGAVIAVGIAPGQVRDIAIECGTCKKASDFPRLRPGQTPAPGFVFFPEGVYRLTSTIDMQSVRFVGVGVVMTPSPGGTSFGGERLN